MTLIKVCGIKNLEVANWINTLKPDAIGLVFAKSKRKVDKSLAMKISNVLDREILRVGVFVNEDLKKVNEYVNDIGLNIVQLHGDEDYEYCRSVNAKVIKAFSIESEDDVTIAKSYKNLYGYLFDAKCEVYRGGEGKTFNWEFLNDIDDVLRERLILAGGLNSLNIKGAIKNINPFMVDVSSGVEKNEEKDYTLTKEFIKLIRE